MKDVATMKQADGRISALDGMRAIAALRVVVWHVTGWALATWLVSAIPAMFFVTGALLMRSFEKRSWQSVLWTRLRRLIPPVVLYGGFVLVLSHAYGASTSNPLTFLIPVVSPHSDLGGGWFTSALWYVSAYIWVLLLSPVLASAARMFGIAAVLAGALLVVVQSQFGGLVGAGSWALGDVVLYSTCALAGMSWSVSGGRNRIPLLAVAAASATLAGLWVMMHRPESGIVNDDHVLHMLVGAAWTAVLLSGAPLLAGFAASRVAIFINSRPLTIYLWHPAVAWTIWHLVPGRIQGVMAPILAVAGTFAVLPFAVWCTGFLEKPDAIGRRLRLAGLRVGMVLLVPVMMNVPVVASRFDPFAAPNGDILPPSAAPKKSVVIADPIAESFVKTETPATSILEREAAMQKILDKYDASMELNGTRVIVTWPDGRQWHGRSSGAKSWNEPSAVGSITKTFTTTLFERMIEEGKITLEEPIGDLGLGFTHGNVTVGQLLTHTSGVPKYDRGSGLMRDGTTPEDVVRWASSQGLRFRPGSRVEYSTTGFVLLGVFLERRTGRTFEDLMTSAFNTGYGYDLHFFRGRYASAGYSTGGVVMKMDDLADWIRRYVWNRTVTKAPWDWDFTNTTGIGIHGYCPCTNKMFTALGHMGGRTFATVDGDGIAVVIDSRGVLVLDNFSQTQALAQSLRLAAGGGRTMVNP